MSDSPTWSINKMGDKVHVIFDGVGNEGKPAWSHIIVALKDWEEFKKDVNKAWD